jgi:hypothetical protein
VPKKKSFREGPRQQHQQLQTTKLTCASAKGGKKKNSVQGLGSSTSSCKQTKLGFASAKGGPGA